MNYSLPSSNVISRLTLEKELVCKDEIPGDFQESYVT